MNKLRLIYVAVLIASANIYAGVNIFNKLYPGDRNDVTGRRGYSFAAQKDFLIDALGRALTGETLNAAHTVELYDIETETLLASVTVNNSSSKDILGYAFESLGTPISIQSGKEYLVIQNETAGDGDLWFGGFIPNYKNDYIAIKGGEWSDTSSGMPTLRHEVDNEYGYGPAAFSIIDPLGQQNAWSPFPANGSTGMSPFVSLWNQAAFTWQAPLSPINVPVEEVCYDVYFGTNPENLSLVSAAQSNESWWPCFILKMGPVHYYWRIDTIDGEDISTGQVWSFSTQSGDAIDGDLTGPQGIVDSKVDIHDLAVIAGDWSPGSGNTIQWPSYINFQPAASDVPAGYVIDDGAAYGDRLTGGTYGWLDGTNYETRARGGASSDLRYDTLNHMQRSTNRVWEIALPEGDYTVHLVMGDPSFADTVNSVDIEGTVMNDPDGADNFDEYNVVVTVSDGNLTIQPADGASNAKICFVDILLNGE